MSRSGPTLLVLTKEPGTALRLGWQRPAKRGLLDYGGNEWAPLEGDGKLWEGSGTAGRLAWLPSDG